MKVEELARELELKSKELLDVIARMGVDGVTHHKHTLSDLQVDMIKKNVNSFLQPIEKKSVNMRRAFGIDKVNGRWGVAVFEFPEGKMEEVVPFKHVTENTVNYKSNVLAEFKKLVSDPLFSDIFKEE